MLHVIGEILIDQFIDNNIISLPGGAPFNVACNIRHFGDQVSFYGSIGKDINGLFLYDYAKGKGFNSLILPMHKNRDTTIAQVTVTNGERSFKFIRNNGADFLLSLIYLKRMNIKKNDIVHIGSLMLSEKQGLSFIKSAIKYIKTIGALFSFDVNYRDDIFTDKITAKRIYRSIIKKADIVKVSNDELDVLSNRKTLKSKLKDLFSNEQNVFVSLGKNGSFFYKDGKIFKVDTIKLKPIDTTGAGDAFYSYILHSLKDGVNVIDIEENIKNILFKANIVGALATQKIGAIDVVPTLEELEQYYKQ